MSNKKIKLIIILGPTASGKSSLGISLAKKNNGIIISADSRQVYKGMDIGTAKVTKKERKIVPHFLLDVVSPKKYYSAAQFKKEALKVIDKYSSQKNIFVVGGSPFYIDSLISKKETFNIPPDYDLRKKLEKLSPEKLFKRLKKLNPKKAKKIDKNNPRRLIRAIEVAKAKPKSKKNKTPEFKVLKIGLSRPREKLYQKIDERVDKRFKQGMVKEVEDLRKKGLSWKRLNSFGLEYRFVAKYLKGQLKKEEMVQKLKYAIHDFVRRQMTWFRKDKSIHWIKNQKQAESLINKFLK
ncbi:MAG: tRNA (adenosine(37)-N6)-dimethylallyltransferase MiaA [Patescibacteria group bacterium]|nr:tRNA (adenosine(37)-N6)-dimethylallyltransferase MiaA [Patescibacteria group bacterium]